MLMLCEEVKKDKWIENPNWIYEIKYDGERALIYINDYKIEKIITRQGKSILSRFPEFKEITFNMKSGLIDSEICVFENGRSNFDLLSLRSHLQDTDKIQDRQSIKPMIMAFDIQEFEGTDVTMKPLEKRKEILHYAMKEGKFIEESIVFDFLNLVWDLVIRLNLEGVIAKHKSSAYENKRSKYWCKIKNWKEEVIEFDDYENAVSEKFGFIKGITLTNKDGIRVAVLGEQHKEVKSKLEQEGVVSCNCQYLDKTKDNKRRFISFKELVK